MNRNVAILGLASTALVALAFGLAWSWRGTAIHEESTSGLVEGAEHASGAPPPALDGGPADPEPERRATEVSEPAATRARFQLHDGKDPSSEQDPILVAGRVLDQERSPIHAARVIVREPSWRQLPGKVLAETTTDRQGRFEIRGIATEVRPELGAAKDGYFPADSQPFAWGATGVELRLREGGVVAGTVRLDPWIPQSKVRVKVEPIPSPGHGSLGRNAPFASPPLRLDADGRFRYGSITESTAVVSVRIENDPWEAARIEDVPVREGFEPQDPRLEPIDLRGKFEVVAVSVVDDSGRSLDGARVLLQSSEDSDVACSRVSSGGRAEFLTRTGPHDFEVDLEGFRHERLAGVYGDQLVRLRRGIPVRILLQGKSPDVTPPDRIAIVLLQSTRDRSTVGGMGSFEDPLQTTLYVASPGRYEVVWYLERGRDRKYLSNGGGRKVDVRDLDGGQDVALEFPYEALAAVK